MANIFVSYARKDSKLVSLIMKEIQGLGHDYWQDTRNLHSGNKWAASIADAIQNCDYFLLFLSHASNASKNVGHEVQIAFENNKDIIIIRLENVKPAGDLRYPLAGIHWTDYFDSDWKAQIMPALGQPFGDSGPNVGELFNEAIHENILGHADRALELYRQVKAIDPHYPGIDRAIRSIEAEIKKGIVNTSGTIAIQPSIEGDLERRASLSIPNMVALVAVLVILIAAAFWGVSYLTQPKQCAYVNVAETDAEAIHWLIEQEARAIRTENMDIIKVIFADDAKIVNRFVRSMPYTWNTPIDRYQVLFQDYDYIESENTNIRKVGSMNGETMYYMSGSQGSYEYKGATYSFQDAADASHWTLRKIDGCWKITAFEFKASGIDFP